MTSKPVIPTWNPWAQAGLVVTATLLGTLLPLTDGQAIFLLLIAAAVTLIVGLWSDGWPRSLRRRLTKSATTPPTT